jgi:dihydroorotate dehydrogenase (NAD+) catalytic subunit
MRSFDLSTEINGIRFPTPLLTASGTSGYGNTFFDTPRLGLGGFITKGISLKPKQGNPPPRIHETPCGLLNSIGLENIGLETFIDEILPRLQGIPVPLIVNVFGESIEEFLELSLRLSQQTAIAALELNVSCPNVHAGGIVFGKDPKILYSLVSQLKRKVSSLPIWVKLTPNVTNIAEFAQVVKEAGGDALTIANSYTGIAVDAEKERFCLGHITGGLTGPAIKPLTQYAVWQVVSQVDLPVIASGGCSNALDAMEYLLMGARAIQIGTMALIQPDIFSTMIREMESFMERKKLSSLKEWIGRLNEDHPRI